MSELENDQPKEAQEIHQENGASASTPQAYLFGPFRIELPARHLLKDDAVVPMTAKVFDTLLVLVKNHERAVGKEELIHAVWPNTFVSDDSLVQNISAIRRALGDDPSQPQYVATLARRGYRFVAPVGVFTGAAATHPVAPAGKPSRATDEVAAPVPRRSAWTSPWALSAAAFAAGIVVAALAVTGLRSTRAQASNAAPIRFREALPPGQMLEGGAALSPDGRFIAYTATDGEGARRLWVRLLGDSDSARPLDGTLGALSPFWSPDGQSIGYFSGRHMKRIAVTGGTPRPVATLQRGLPLGASWGANDQILFVDQGKVFMIGAGGGTPTVAADPSRTSAGDLRWPYFLPDGRHFVFVVNSDYPGRSGTYLGVLGSSDATRLLPDADAPVVCAEPGYLLFVRDHALMAQAFDLTHGRMTGEPKTVLGDLSDALEVSAAQNGMLAVSLHTGAARAAWYDRTGKELGTFAVPKQIRNLTLSRDDKQALATSYEGGSLNLWKIDLERNVATKLVGNGGFPHGRQTAHTTRSFPSAPAAPPTLSCGRSWAPSSRCSSRRTASRS